MRKSDLFLWCFSLLLLGLFATLTDTYVRQQKSAQATEPSVTLIRQLGLTDLALFTEARYTRHLSQADLHSAFQNHPTAFEHFPSGSLLLPPQRMR